MLIILLFVAANQIFSQELTIEFTTENIVGAKYSPNHVLAVWVTNESGFYQKSLLVIGFEEYRSLKNWYTNSGGDKTDATTGETYRTHSTRSASWDLTNFVGSVVPNGNYYINIEMASQDQGGPYRMIAFTKDGNSTTITPDDSENFKNITLTYDSGTAAINTIDIESEFLNVFPNPANQNTASVEVRLLQNSPTTIKILDLSGRLLSFNTIELSKGIHKISLNESVANLQTGNYLVLVETNHYVVGNLLKLTK